MSAVGHSGTSTAVVCSESTLPLVDPVKGKELVRKLNKILQNYLDWEDPLSVRIIDWGFAAIREIKSQEPSKIEEVAKRELSKVKAILLCPVSGLPLKDPVLDGQLTWERQRLEEYQSLSPFSPYDRERIVVKEHLFAKKILKFLAKAQGTATAYPITVFQDGPSSFVKDVDPRVSLRFHEFMANQVRLRQENYEITQRLVYERELTSELKRLINEVLPRLQQERDEALARNEQSIADHIDATIEATKTQVENMKRVVGELQSDVRLAQAATRAAEQQVETHKSRIAYLEWGLRENQRRIRELEDDSGGGCSIQ